jgi:hypothetical protein
MLLRFAVSLALLCAAAPGEDRVIASLEEEIPRGPLPPERRNPLMDTPTTGAIARGRFYFIANSMSGKLDPVRILKVKLKG